MMSAKKIDILTLEKRAKKLRLDMAIEKSSFFVSKTSTTEGHSHFSLYEDKLPLTSNGAIDFNIEVTDAVIRKHILTEGDPYIVTFLGAKVIEQTFTHIFDNTKPTTPVKNLSVAKHYGTFFTSPEVAEAMISNLSIDKKKTNLIDPCLGSGVLLASALLYGRVNNYQKLIGVELDTNIASWASELLKRVAFLTKFSGDISIINGNGLDFIIERLDSDFFDASDLIINPPYGRLRITKDRATNTETAINKLNKNKVCSIHELNISVKNDAKKIREKHTSIFNEKGMIEYSKVFFRACAEASLQGGRVSIISPDSWMSGNDGEQLRKFIIMNRLIKKIELIRENKGSFSTVNQATSITLLDSKTKYDFVISNFHGDDKMEDRMEYDKLSEISRVDFAIPRVTGVLLKAYEKLSSLQKIGQVDWIVNARGEIDQTAQKNLFIEDETLIPLIRGEHVERFLFTHSSSEKKPSFLKENEFKDFISNKPKRKHYELERIVGRQCSYSQQSRRLIFCRVPALHAIGNSCNYIAILGDDENERRKRSYFILGLLNSSIFDWYFRVKNSNNHVANYEIDNFPFPTDNKWCDLISVLAYQIEHHLFNGESNQSLWLMDLLEAVVGIAYGLSVEIELPAILAEIEGENRERIINYAKHLSNDVRFPKISLGEVFFNHKDPTLSDLDRVIISYVPEGGNWQSIPDSVPSERLKQIREMSAERGVVRTTYYGRLRRDQPSYTINTYFNRPGNGTHIHPVLNRTLTAREAARLQSFPDSYIFLGSEGAVRNQIGNAVPPILSAAIGRKFITYAKNKTCVDIFCGAGGLSFGLESAGWKVVSAVDNNKEALETYCFNRPCDLEPIESCNVRTALFNRDLQNKGEFDDVVSRIEKVLDGRELDLLVGGPPCQGFSHAGYRLSDDTRNDLASIYLHFAERLKPRIFILENVEGLATFNKGQVLRDICSTLKELGYEVKEPVWKLTAEQYGAPQMRKRVFIVATIDDTVDLTPPEPLYERCAGRRANKMGATLFGLDLPTPFTVADAFSGLSLPGEMPEKLKSWLLK